MLRRTFLRRCLGGIAAALAAPLAVLARPRPLRGTAINTTTLKKSEWIELDKAVMGAARPRLKLWEDLATQQQMDAYQNGLQRNLVLAGTTIKPV